MFFRILKWIFFIGIFISLAIVFLIVFKGIIYIELLIILILSVGFIWWKIWFKLSKKKLLKNYSPENDKGKKCEKGKEFIRTPRAEGTESKAGTSTSSDVRPEQPERRELLSSASADDDGKNSSGRRKTGKGTRGFFARRKRRAK